MTGWIVIQPGSMTGRGRQPQLVLPPPMIRAELLGDREIALRLAGGTRKYGAGTEYAWKVYLGGEHLEEYDRAFDPQASYQLLLAQDGIYRFELVIRQGNEMLSILSEEYPVSHEVDILRAGERTVLLNYTGPAAEADGASFAWHVYRNGERVSESERSYQQIPAHFVQLEADGTYTFKCFCMVSGEKRSVLSFPVTVKNGCIEDDPRLGEISMEDAVRLTKPEVEILATITESRTVRLTVIDNSLNAGPEYTYAWYVYRGGERLREYDRGYSADPEYDLILAEDGEYTFKLFYRTGDSRKSVVSETFSIGEAGYGETD